MLLMIKEKHLKVKIEKDKPIRVPVNKAPKMSFREKREFETLEKEIALLEKEKREIEHTLSNNLTDSNLIISLSDRIGVIISLIDEKSFRWLELSELE